MGDRAFYCARHDFGTYLLNSTGNSKLVTDNMGPTAMKYQHPELEIVREAINARHILRHTEENAG